MCWNLPYNGISVAMGGITVDKIVSDPGLRRLADLVMDETIAAGNADLEARGLAARTPAGRWRAAPGPESDARLDAAWARAFRRSRDDAAAPAGPSTVGEVISYPF